jgi:DNA-binding NarL/FixJ family response regulator
MEFSSSASCTAISKKRGQTMYVTATESSSSAAPMPAGDSRPSQVFVVEDSDVVRALWRTVVAKIAGLSLRGEFNRASTAIAAIRREPPHVVLLDINLSDGNGMEVLRVVAAEYPMTKVIVVSNCADTTHRRYFTKAGAYAFYDKSHELPAMRHMLEHLAGFRSPASLS